jgi:hypothetical protein
MRSHRADRFADVQTTQIVKQPAVKPPMCVLLIERNFNLPFARKGILGSA